MKEEDKIEPSEETKLPHESNRAIIGFTKSPQGMDVIGMTFGGKDWILLATMESITADRVRVQLKSELGIDSLPGLPFDWRTSLERKELVLTHSLASTTNKRSPVQINNPVGIYVPAEEFDNAPKPSRTY